MRPALRQGAGRYLLERGVEIGAVGDPFDADLDVALEERVLDVLLDGPRV